MELSQLEAFERAAREGSFTRAAHELGLTQPSVSARIAALEAELGGPLFIRGGRKLRLTPLGRRFLPYTERALAVLADGLQEVRNYHTGKVGQVTVAALNTMGMYLLPDPLERFRSEYPVLDVTIKLTGLADVLERLYDGTATLGLTGAPLFDRGVSIQAHFQEPIRGVVAADHPLAIQQAEQGSLHMADIYRHSILRVNLGPRATAFIQGVVESARRGSGSAVVTVPASMAVRMVILGQGVAFLPQSYVQRHIESGRVVPLNIAEMPQLFSEPLLVTLRGRELDRPNAEFIRMFKAHWRHMLLAG